MKVWLAITPPVFVAVEGGLSLEAPWSQFGRSPVNVSVLGLCFLASCEAVHKVLHWLWLGLLICQGNLWEHFTAPSVANGLSESCRKDWFCFLILRAMMVALFVSFLDLFWIYVWPRVWKSCYKSRNICWGFKCR